MALSDYDTAAEKIAALKAATLDPALVKLVTAEITPSEPIYMITSNFNIAEGTSNIGRVYSMFPPRVSPPSTVSGAALYLIDSEITYDDPIETYQNRLASIIDCELQMSGSFTVGSTGAIILGYNNDSYYVCRLYIDSALVLDTTAKNSQMCASPFALPPGSVVNEFHSNLISYIDLPADW